MDMLIECASAARTHKCCAYLRLGETEAGGQFGAFGQRQVLGALKPPVELLELQGTVDGAGLAHFLALAVHSQPGVLALVGEGAWCAVGADWMKAENAGIIMGVLWL